MKIEQEAMGWFSSPENPDSIYGRMLLKRCIDEIKNEQDINKTVSKVLAKLKADLEQALRDNRTLKTMCVSCPYTRAAHEEAAGMGLAPEFFSPVVHNPQAADGEDSCCSVAAVAKREDASYRTGYNAAIYFAGGLLSEQEPKAVTSPLAELIWKLKL